MRCVGDEIMCILGMLEDGPLFRRATLEGKSYLISCWIALFA